MKKPTKLILCITAALILCAASFYAGSNYNTRDMKSFKEAEYAALMKNEIGKLCDVLGSDIFTTPPLNRKLPGAFDSLLLSLGSVIELADDAPSYTENTKTAEQAAAFAKALMLFRDAVEYGISLDGEIIVYSLSNKGLLTTEEIELFSYIKTDLLQIVNELDSSLLCFDEFNIKYAPNNILTVYSGINKDYRDKGKKTRTEQIEQEMYNYSTVHMINPPDLIVESFPNNYTFSRNKYSWRSNGRISTEVSPEGFNYYIGLTEPHNELENYLKYHDSVTLYSGDIFRLSFDTEPDSCEIYICDENSEKSLTNYTLHEYYFIPDDCDKLTFELIGQWENKTCKYFFCIEVIEPANWSEYEKDN